MDSRALSPIVLLGSHRHHLTLPPFAGAGWPSSAAFPTPSVLDSDGAIPTTRIGKGFTITGRAIVQIIIFCPVTKLRGSRLLPFPTNWQTCMFSSTELGAKVPTNYHYMHTRLHLLNRNLQNGIQGVVGAA